MKYILLIATLYTGIATAGQPTDMFINIDENVTLTINMERHCTKWDIPKGHEVFEASITDKSIGKTAQGCWELEDSPKGAVVHADIVLPDEKSFFSYRYPADEFETVPNL
jgi:hypothetical protein